MNATSRGAVLGKEQRSVLQCLIEHKCWSHSSGWTWSTRSRTEKIIHSLVKYGLVEQQQEKIGSRTLPVYYATIAGISLVASWQADRRREAAGKAALNVKPTAAANWRPVEECRQQHASGRICWKNAGHVERGDLEHEDVEGIHWTELPNRADERVKTWKVDPGQNPDECVLVLNGRRYLLGTSVHAIVFDLQQRTGEGTAAPATLMTGSDE